MRDSSNAGHRVELHVVGKNEGTSSKRQQNRATVFPLWGDDSLVSCDLASSVVPSLYFLTLIASNVKVCIHLGRFWVLAEVLLRSVIFGYCVIVFGLFGQNKCS
jgi:hypothetical protein